MNEGDVVEMVSDSDKWSSGDTAIVIDIVDDGFEEYPYQVEFGDGSKHWVREEDIMHKMDS